MMTWKQKCEEERIYYTILWKWNPKREEYDIKGCDDLTFEEAKRYFDKTRIEGLTEQVEIFRELSEEEVEIIARKYEGYETWDRDEL